MDEKIVHMGLKKLCTGLAAVSFPILACRIFSGFSFEIKKELLHETDHGKCLY